MWNRKKYILSSFVGMNQGKILECYGKLSVDKKKCIHPFCSQNTGFIENASNDAEHEEEQERSQEEPLHVQAENIIEIHSAEQLIEIVKQVNLGDAFYYAGNYKLMEDLDLKEEKLVPMGNSELTPFCGIFDGNGHSIKNMNIQEKRSECAGFFGYLKKAVVQNLSVEGKVNGGRYSGALAGISDDSVITSCFASAKIYGSYCAGGFVGKNTGTITHCYFSGSVHYKSLCSLVIPAGVALFCVAGVLCFYFISKNTEKSLPSFYSPVSIEEDASQFEQGGSVKERDNISCSFATKVSALKGDAMAEIKFKNPRKSDKHVIVQIQITDQELIDTIGTNGRTKEELETLKKTGKYKPETSRQIIAESGTVPPGYQLDEVQLNTLSDGTVLPKGKYNAIVCLILYDVFTNEKEIVNTETMITLNIES